MKRNHITHVIISISLTLLMGACSKSSEDRLAPDSGSCDTVNMKYTLNILPIIKANCYSCHGNGIISQGINLDGYNNLLIRVNDGKLIGVITHASGYPPMPQGQPKLSDCNINKIKSWINRGALNN